MAGGTDLLPDPGKLTYEDYVTLPEDGRRYEILDGELEVSSSPSSTHQFVLENLAFALSSHVRACGSGRIWLAPLDVILATTTIVQPDIVYISNERSRIVTERGIEAAPDLVVEILSDFTARRDRGAKKHLYARYGISRYWLVDPTAKTLEILALRDDGYEQIATHCDCDVAVLDIPAGLKLDLADVWRND